MLRGIIIFLKSCPSPPSPSLRRRHRCCPCAGDGCPCPPAATLPRGGHPCGRHLHGRRPCRCYRCCRSPFQVVALAGGASTRRLPSCGCRTRSRPPLVGWPWATVYRPLAAAPAAVAPCGHRAAAGHPRAAAPAVWPRAGAAPLRAGPGRSRSPLCRGPCRNRPPLCMGALAAADRPFAWGPWLQPAAPCRGAMAAIGRPCKGAGHGHAQLPLARATFTAKIQ
ncbi:hypothetical protein BHM03_00042907 [Ensete ventricosum]|nr:hypothetical protein BHM03_00042907 [Ensete ventricosum]